MLVRRPPALQRERLIRHISPSGPLGRGTRSGSDAFDAIVTMTAGKRLRDRPPFGSNAYIHVMTQTIWVVSTYIFIFSALLFDSGYFCVQSLPLQIGKILPISRSNTLARIDGYDRTETCVRLPVGQYDHYPKNRKLALSEFRFFFQRKFGSCTQTVV